MIRNAIHTGIDFILDVLAEAWAMLLDLGPVLINLARATRARWAERRAVPGWQQVHMFADSDPDARPTTAGTVTESERGPEHDLVLTTTGGDLELEDHPGLGFLESALAESEEHQLQQV